MDISHIHTDKNGKPWLMPGKSGYVMIYSGDYCLEFLTAGGAYVLNKHEIALIHIDAGTKQLIKNSGTLKPLYIYAFDLKESIVIPKNHILRAAFLAFTGKLILNNQGSNTSVTEPPNEGLPPFLHISRDKEGIDSIAKLMEITDRYSGTQVVFSEVMRALLSTFAAEYENEQELTDYYKIKDILDSLYLEKDAVEQACRLTNKKPHNLVYAFKSATGITPAAYITGKRMERARLLLETGAHKVCEVSAKCGYENIPFFTKSFKQYYGITPKQAAKRPYPKN